MTRFRSLTGSIAAKFAVIFLALGAMTTAAIVIGLLVFGALSEALRVFIDDNLPGIEASVDVTARTGTVQSAMTDVLLAQDRETLQQAGAELQGGVTALKQAVRGLSAAAEAEIDPLLADLDIANAALIRALERSMAEQKRVREMVAAFVQLSEEANGALVSLADDAYRELQLGGEATVDTVTSALKGLVNAQFARMTALMRIRAEINLLSGITLVLAGESGMFIEATLGDLATTSLTELESALAELPAGVVKASYMAEIRAAADFFRERGEMNDYQRSDLRQEVLALRQSSALAVTSAIDDVSFELAFKADEAASGNEAAIRRLLDVQVRRMRVAADIDSAIKAVLARALLGVAAQDVNTAAGAQSAVDAAHNRLEAVLADQELPEGLTAILGEIRTLVAAEGGMVRARRRMLEAQADASARSNASGRAIALIVNAASVNAGQAVAAVVSGSETILAHADTARVQFGTIAFASLALLFAAPVLVWASILRPMARVTRATERLSRGNLAPVEGFDRTGGEIGRMARALEVFRDGMLDRERMQAAEQAREVRERQRQREGQARELQRKEEARVAERQREDEARARATAEAQERERVRAAAEQERRARAAEQEQVVERLASALDQLAAGDLTVSIETEFAGAYDSLRRNFNAAVVTLEELITALMASADTVNTTSQDINATARYLMHRTESSAATLEQTSAAVTELSESAGATADRAREADRIMQITRDNAKTSQGTVRNAVETMTEVKASSAAISKIVDLIDDIAFQTNLLALNAGVEAARAGEQGRGFAVVAMEVRSLAHRSSDAAKEINGLISATRDRISRGVAQVGEAGNALNGILDLVGEVSGQISAIAGAANEQSAGVREISHAIDQLDRATQDNAALFQQSAGSSQMLTEEARTLFELSARFRTRGTTAPQGTAAESPVFSPEGVTDPVPKAPPAETGRQSGAKAGRETEGLPDQGIGLEVASDFGEAGAGIPPVRLARSA